MRIFTITTSVFFLFTIVNTFPYDLSLQVESGESENLTGEDSNLEDQSESEKRDERILGILGNWGFGYPGFGLGAYGGSCRITKRCPISGYNQNNNKKGNNNNLNGNGYWNGYGYGFGYQ